MERSEHEREIALREELMRQEKLEQLARRFDRKAAMRETWLSENQRLVSQVGSVVITRYFINITSVTVWYPVFPYMEIIYSLYHLCLFIIDNNC